MQHQEARLKNMLEQVRIKAKTVTVPWDHVTEKLRDTREATCVTTLILFVHF